MSSSNYRPEQLNALHEMGLGPFWQRPLTQRAAPLADPSTSAVVADDKLPIELLTEHSIEQAIEHPIEYPITQATKAPHFAPAAEMHGTAHGSDIAQMEWAALQTAVPACTRCGLCKSRTQTVFGVGDQQAEWMLVGEAPGAEEDARGEPFVGQAGKLLDNMLHSLGLNRQKNVYIANVLKCRPPGNRNPEPNEVNQCEPFLKRQIALVKPKLIVVLGRFAAQSLLNTDASIASLRGKQHSYRVHDTDAAIPVVVSYHPAYLLRNPADKAKSWEDLCLAKQTLQQPA